MDYVAPPKAAVPLSETRQLLWLRRLAVFTFLWAFLVILLGAYTRLVDAGLGCPDWPGCYGFLTVPNEPHEIALAESRFPHAPVETHKGWPEMIHRYLASTLGLLIFAVAALSWRVSREGAPQVALSPGVEKQSLRRHTLLLSGLVVVQGLFGMWTVTLKLWPQVVTAHLLGGFATFSLLALLAMRLLDRPLLLPRQEVAALRRMRPLVLVAIALLIVQISLGAWVSSNYAALACTGLPECNGQWWPATDFRDGFNILQSIGPNYLGGQLHFDARVTVHLTHRIGAVIVTAVLLGTVFLLWRRTHSVRLRQTLMAVVVLLIAQVALGITNVLALLPLGVAVAHNGVAAWLLVATVWLAYRLFRLQERPADRHYQHGGEPG